MKPWKGDSIRHAQNATRPAIGIMQTHLQPAGRPPFLPNQASMDETATAVLALERAALDRWGKGDPDGFLEICDPEVSYFDPFQERRVDGRDALGALYATFRGQIHIERDQIVNPRVQVLGDVAILTFNFVSFGSEGSARWHATEAYRRSGETWRIIHTHWSLLKV
jgi:ketosteroid isomerase-like protein